MDVTTEIQPSHHHAASRHCLSELELLRLKVAHLNLELALTQAQAQITRLEQAREALLRQILREYVRAEDVDDYSIDLEHGTILPRQKGV